MDNDDLLEIPDFLLRPLEDVNNSDDAADHSVPDALPYEGTDNSETQGPQPADFKQTNLKPHPFADMFPMMTGEDFTALVTSIQKDGLEEPIVTYEGKILDGRNRYAACNKAGVELKFDEYAGDDPLELVLRKNLHRRQLQTSQRAMVAAKMANLKKGGDHKSEDFKASNDGLKIEDAAKILNVSAKTVERAKSVLGCGDDELIARVECGEMSASAAAKQLTQAAKPTSPPISDGEVESQRLLKLWNKTGEDGRGLFLEAIRHSSLGGSDEDE